VLLGVQRSVVVFLKLDFTRLQCSTPTLSLKKRWRWGGWSYGFRRAAAGSRHGLLVIGTSDMPCRCALAHRQLASLLPANHTAACPQQKFSLATGESTKNAQVMPQQGANIPQV